MRSPHEVAGPSQRQPSSAVEQLIPVGQRACGPGPPQAEMPQYRAVVGGQVDVGVVVVLVVVVGDSAAARLATSAST